MPIVDLSARYSLPSTLCDLLNGRFVCSFTGKLMSKERSIGEGSELSPKQSESMIR
jgi:hypothetical protein